ncbi:MAG: HTH domain-containing protein, partial [Dehalococcoidia bacterium]
MYLHEAITQVLEESGNVPMTMQDIADIISQRRLFVSRDGSPADARKVGWRAVGDVAKSVAP